MDASDLHRHLERRGDEQDVDQMVFWNANAAIPDLFSMHGLLHYVPV